MSYILDALKRSEAERSRGAVPGLHARQVSSPPPPAERDLTDRWRWWGAAALLLAVLAVGLWAWRTPIADSGQTALPVVVSPTAVPAPPPPSLAATTFVAALQAASQTTPPTLSPPPGAAAGRPVLTPDAFVAALRAASAAQRPGPAARPSPVTAPAPLAMPAPAQQVVAKAVPAQAGTVNVPLLGELSEDLRRQIPALAITGVVYSENPGQRLLLVNNQVLTQGSLVAPELTLEEIQPKSSVLAFRGTRFRVAH